MTEIKYNPKDENILKHIAYEEGYREAPYIDPNYQQANIGYAHSFYFFPQSIIAESKKYAKGKPRENFLMTKIPKQHLNMRWSKEVAASQLWRDYTAHRNRAKLWLDEAGMGDNERLVDQLGMLFYGAKADGFMRWAYAKDKLAKHDYDGLSQAASRFGRVADGIPMKALAKRRQAERDFYLGKDLPVGKDSEGIKVPAPLPRDQQEQIPPSRGAYGGAFAARSNKPDAIPSLDLGKFATNELPNIEPYDQLAATLDYENIVGQEGIKKANEAVWKVIGNGEEMPEEFSATDWANGFAARDHAMRSQDELGTYEEFVKNPEEFRGFTKKSANSLESI